jgi:hypothetical protein
MLAHRRGKLEESGRRIKREPSNHLTRRLLNHDDASPRSCLIIVHLLHNTRVL